MKKWGFIVVLLLIAFVAYWSFMIEGKDSKDSWALFKGFSFFIVVAYILLLLMQYIIRSRIKMPALRIKQVLAENKINKWSEEDGVWDYRFMMEQATQTFTHLMEAKSLFNAEVLRGLATTAAYAVIKKDIDRLKEKRKEINDLIIQGSAIIRAENKPGLNEDNFEAVFMGTYKYGNIKVNFSSKLGFIRDSNKWLLNDIKN